MNNVIEFKLGETSIDYFDFAKHHRRVPIHIGRTYEDGSYNDLIADETFRKDVADNQSMTFTAQNHIYQDSRLQPVTDLFIWLENAEYIERSFPYYSLGSVNTSQTSYVRLAFQFEDALAFLETEYNTSGTFASSFSNMINNGSMIQEIIDELLDEGLSVEDCGIEKWGPKMYRIMAVSPKGWIEPIEVEVHELKEALIGVELYDFKHTVHEDYEDPFEHEEEEHEISS